MSRFSKWIESELDLPNWHNSSSPGFDVFHIWWRDVGLSKYFHSLSVNLLRQNTYRRSLNMLRTHLDEQLITFCVQCFSAQLGPSDWHIAWRRELYRWSVCCSRARSSAGDLPETRCRTREHTRTRARWSPFSLQDPVATWRQMTVCAYSAV